jgi:hypothetical protein
VTASVLKLRYPTASAVIREPLTSRISLALEAGRSEVGLTGRVENAELFRDALLTACAVMKSDLRYKGKDRTAYLAHLMKQGKRATAAIWEAQKSYLEGAYSDDAPRQRGLDPVFSVDPDEASLEVFSRDESAYARLALSSDLFGQRGAAHGTTLADISDAFIDQVERIRTYQPLELRAATKEAGEAVAREVDVPDEWLRGFLQVQSAATLPTAVAHLQPVDLYNVLFALRTHKAKKAPRGLRFELVPGMRPRVVIEPWELAFESHGEPYRGAAPRVARVFGRQRLLCLARLLPHLVPGGVRVHLLGAGLPSFWVLDMGVARLTLALTSWSESKWASATSFDALMPKEKADSANRAADTLAKHGPLGLAELAKLLKATPEETRTNLQRACLAGRVLFDVSRGVYRPRLLLAEPVDPSRIRYGSPREAAAHRLLGDEGAKGAEVAITKVHVVAGEGQEITGEVRDKHARRTLSPRFMIDLEGQAVDAWCNCPTYQRSALREGPCEHMIALFVTHKRALAEAERLRGTAEGRKVIRAETRNFVRRDAAGAQVAVLLSLDDRLVREERKEAAAGHPLGEGRFQRMWFDTDADARREYFARLDELTVRGFIDTDAASA